MTRPLPRAGTLGAVIVALTVTTLCSTAATAGAERAPSRLLVNGDEWSLVLSKTKLAPGRAIVQLFNAGEDPHNLRLRKAKGGAVRRIDLLEPGETGERELYLGRGKRYRLWCSLPFHRERGMKATLKVAKSSNPS